MNNLSPCPFCGSTKILVRSVEAYNCLSDSHEVICSDCCAVTSNYSTEQQAIEAWNKRSNPNCDECQFGASTVLNKIKELDKQIPLPKEYGDIINQEFWNLM